MRTRLGVLLVVGFSVSLSVGCGDDGAPGLTFYEREIEPIFLQSCARNVAGCHEINADDPYGFAAGNLDVTSFENVQKRQDLLRPFGPYSIPAMLIKGVGATGSLEISYGGEDIALEIQHSGGNILQVGGIAYQTLLEWMLNGATETGVPPAAQQEVGDGDCSTELPVGFDPSVYTAHPDFGEFRDDVQPVLRGCESGNCHGAPQSDFYLTCGDSEEEVAFNFSSTWAFVNTPADNSQILQVPLAVDSGGFFHTGGEHFSSRSDASYQTLLTWAEKVGRLEFGEGDPGKEFFADHVQPVLLKRGCSLEGCHSPSSTNDFKLRSGSQGFFSAIALERNYGLLREEFLAFEMPDIRRGRAGAKNVLPIFGGISHRGGPSLETPGSGGADPANCPPVFSPTDPAICVLQEWLRIERQTLIASGDVLPLGNGDTVPVVYVNRQESHVASPLEFDTYEPNSDLMIAQMTLDGTGGFTAIGGSVSLLDTCAGAANRAVVDVRGPDVHPDGETVAFAMRTSANDPLAIYTVNINGTGCTQVRDSSLGNSADGILMHEFDPAWSPDGNMIVYASTRGGTTPSPSVSRALFEPQSDIWRMNPDGTGVQQVTFLTNSEVSPQMMREGRIIMTTEKVSDGFYQLSGRRINWDLTDYHPLIAQRSQSPLGDPSDPNNMFQSMGYAQATDIREANDGNFIFIASDRGARGGAGALAVFNRSVGPFELGREDPGFMKAVVFPDPAATGRVGSNTNGAYRSPYMLPDGRLMVSYANYSGDLGNASSLAWDLVAIDQRTGARETIIGGAGAQVDAVLAIKLPPRKLFLNRRQLVFGGSVDTVTTGGDGFAVVHFPDAPQVFTLLVANLRRGRPAHLYREATEIAVWVENPAPPGTNSGSNADGTYQSRTRLGSASLAEDGSVKIRVPSSAGVILELVDDSGNTVVTMTEEHQLGPGEVISLGIVEELFDAVCGGCHGSVTGSELDIHVTPDALTGASASLSVDDTPVDVVP